MGNKKTILVVDDDPHILEVIEARLLSAGYRVQKANSGNHALKALQETHTDLMISDIKMPIMDGNEVAEYIRKSNNYKYLPIIAITGDSSGVKKGLFSNLLTKPFKLDHLLYLVESFIS